MLTLIVADTTGEQVRFLKVSYHVCGNFRKEIVYDERHENIHFTAIEKWQKVDAKGSGKKTWCF